MTRVFSATVLKPDPQIIGRGDWSYVVRANLPGVDEPVVLKDIVPHDRKWDPDEWDIESVPPGGRVLCELLEGGQMQWYFNEPRATEECDLPLNSNALIQVVRLLQGPR